MTQRATVLTDSSAGMPPNQVERLHIASVPIHLTIGSQEYRDGRDLDPPVLYAALEQGQPVKSAAPSPLDYLDAIEDSKAQHVVVITPAAEFTWMHRNATLAAELATRGVTVVDSRSATAGHGLVVLAAARVAEAGGSVDDVVRRPRTPPRGSTSWARSKRSITSGPAAACRPWRSAWPCSSAFAPCSGSKRAWPNASGCLARRRPPLPAW